MAEDLPLSDDAPGGMIQYRRALTTSFFFKAYLHVLKSLHSEVNDCSPNYLNGYTVNIEEML